MNRPLLIAVVTLLAATKFILVPWVGHQQSIQEQLLATTKRLQRAQSLVLQKESLSSSSEKLTTKLKNLLAELPHVTSSTQYQLEFQQQLQKELEKISVSLEQFAWNGQVALIEPDIFQATISLRLRGDAGNVASFFSEVETDKPHIKILNMTVNSRKKISLSDEITTTLVINVIYRESEA